MPLEQFVQPDADGGALILLEQLPEHDGVATVGPTRYVQIPTASDHGRTGRSVLGCPTLRSPAVYDARPRDYRTAFSDS